MNRVRGYKKKSCSTQLSSTVYKNKTANRFFLLSNSQDVVFIMLISVKMPIIVGILTFISMINFRA